MPKSSFRNAAALVFPLSVAGPLMMAQAPPLLTIKDAIDLAMKENRQVRAASLGVGRARQETSAFATSRLPQLQVYALGGEALSSIQFTIPRGVLGNYAGTGPIPAKDSNITTARQFTGLILGQAAQPLSQLWKIHLALMSFKLDEHLAEENVRAQKQEIAHSVRDLYYQIAQTQTQLESAEANEKFLAELQQETDRNLAEQNALKGESLAVRAKLSQQRYQLLNLRDTLETQKESLNRLLGRDLDVSFAVEVEPVPGTGEIDLKAARNEALAQRPEIREARLQTKKAETDVRRQRAEYIPDVSANVTYFSLPNISFLPTNIVQAGFSLQWQPFDWGQKRHKTESLKDAAKQKALAEQDAEQQVLLDVNAKFRALAESRALLDTVALSREAEHEKLRVVTNRYGQKAALLSDVLQQEGTVSQADSDYRKAVAAFWKAKASFDLALGRE